MPFRQPLHSEHCRSQRNYRHSVFIGLSRQPRRTHSLSFSPCRSYFIPIKFIGGDVGYRPPVQKTYCIKHSASSSLAGHVYYRGNLGKIKPRLAFLQTAMPRVKIFPPKSEFLAQMHAYSSRLPQNLQTFPKCN